MVGLSLQSLVWSYLVVLATVDLHQTVVNQPAGVLFRGRTTVWSCSIMFKQPSLKIKFSIIKISSNVGVSLLFVQKIRTTLTPTAR